MTSIDSARRFLALRRGRVRKDRRALTTERFRFWCAALPLLAANIATAAALSRRGWSTEER